MLLISPICSVIYGSWMGTISLHFLTQLEQVFVLGKDPIYDTIRKNSSSSAEHLLEAIFTTLNEFIGGARIDDDITSVVIKISPDQGHFSR
jgi:hypothetical protein